MPFYKITTFCLFWFFGGITLFSQNIDTIVAPYTSVHYRGSAMITINDNPLSCQYNVVSVIDSFLYIQLNVVGLEAGRGLATPDNILYINKLQKNYYSGDYSVFEKLLDMEIDFYTLQDVFTGTPKMVPEDVELSYQRDSLSYEYPFFSTLTCEYYTLSLKLDVKKVTFNAAPSVSAVVPRNFKEIEGLKTEGLMD